MTTPHTLIPAGFAEITFGLQLTGDPEAASFSIGCDGVNDAASLAGAVASWYANFIDPDSFIGALSSSYTLVQVSGRTDPDGSNLVYDVDTAVPGSGGADAMPSNCAALVRKNSAVGGRANRGRMYLPGVLAPDQIDQNGYLIAPALGGLQDAADKFFDLGDASDFQMQILHASEVRDPDNPAPAMIPNPNPDPTLVTSLVVDPRIATQRRRLR